MLERGEKPSEDSLADIAYLARSANRVIILNTLVSGSYTSRDLEQATGVSRSTLERIVSELERRDWIERTTQGEYTATTAGEFAMSEFAPLADSMTALRALGDAVEWLPREELSIGLHHFSDAIIRVPNSNSATAPAAYMAKLLREATEFACLVRIAPPLGFEIAMRDRAATGKLTTEHVVTEDELAYIAEQPDRVRRWREYLNTGVDVFCYAGDVPCNLFVIDETVLVVDREPNVCAFIESENETVRVWASDMIGTYRAEADRLRPDTFREICAAGLERNS
ncbi:helix-turn-helix transcriptional regulator [Natrinema amylolyticum]|uniref:helix-turn-helix transcriptional regulator n=1 Tax=Natrinema amylolyticum TaxID=2878679 RepID=UPI001CFA4F03|nr:helix-turn-helix domain-containing protein [Natrinema amylolyticum]